MRRLQRFHFFQMLSMLKPDKVFAALIHKRAAYRNQPASHCRFVRQKRVLKDFADIVNQMRVSMVNIQSAVSASNCK